MNSYQSQDIQNALSQRAAALKTNETHVYQTKSHISHTSIGAHELLTYKVQHAKWVDRMMKLAVENVATWSKDTTKVGCVVATRDAKIAGTGYNGLLPCYNDDILALQGKTWKNNRMIHAEQNALANLTVQNSEPLFMFISLPPCLECAKRIALQGNVVAVYARVNPDDKYEKRWNFSESRKLLQEANIQYFEIAV